MKSKLEEFENIDNLITISTLKLIIKLCEEIKKEKISVNQFNKFLDKIINICLECVDNIKSKI